MDEISIITAFFDIGRGDWTPDKGLPHYLQRTTDTYFERYSHLATLENEMVVFTSPELESRVLEIRENKKTKVITFDFFNEFKVLREKIKEIQSSVEYTSRINPRQIKNPEYWNPDYVIVNALKSFFARTAIDGNFATNDLVAWLDFGYCRSKDTLNGITKWCYPFDKDKIHLFNIKEFQGDHIQEIIFNNDVHMTGPCIVAGKNMWLNLEKLVDHSLKVLIENNLIDDDQTLLLMSYLTKPEMFELHRVSPDDWFVAFKKYSK